MNENPCSKQGPSLGNQRELTKRVQFGITDCFTMSDAELFRHLMDHLFSFYYRKIGQIPECDHRPFVEKGAITQSLFEMFAKAMFALCDTLALAWGHLGEEELVKVLSTPENYVSSVMKICIIEECLTPIYYEKLVHVCCVVTALGVYIYNTTPKKFYKLTPRILTVFFENKLIHGFKKRGGWNRLEKYLASQDYLQFSGDWTDYMGPDNKSKKRIPKRVHDKLFELFITRMERISSKKCLKEWEEQLVKDLTRQVVSTLDASLLAELKVSPTDEKGSTSILDEESKSVSELGAVGGRSREHSVTSERNETSGGKGKTDDIEAILSDIKNMFSELVSVTVSPSSDETAKRLASNLDPFFERLKSNLERVVSILNLL
ncbi:uncharacterized protein NPIL_464251 [Nephila pilipes]|uniref:Uncharacterized protein n=1 Tax=Nephila pilipes TaxID=299642 RepID=A0A8X6N083_NEPPI|nr:uncharacterized protein NPIL_464251 [Nephila pilipes]